MIEESYGSISKSKSPTHAHSIANKEKSMEIQNYKQAHHFSSSPIIVGLLFAGLGIFFISSLRSQRYHHDHWGSNFIRSNIDSNVASNSAFEFSFYRDGYSALDLHHDFLVYSFLNSYDAVIEPYAAMNLLVSNGGSSNYYKYSVCKTDGSNSCASGALSTTDATLSQPIKMACSPYDEMDITISSYENSKLISTSTGTAVCMYVRREIRSLTESDREAMLDAMHTLWVVSENEGRELYGSNYHDATFLLEFHHFNAAWQDADHIHEGNGFLPQHIKMTNIFELSMQSVDPSVTLPYWDFTLDSNSPVQESVVMSAEYFGSMTNPTNQKYGFTYEDDSVLDAAIPDGRWAYIKADMNDRYDDLKFGYGYMRAPWNLNPSPYVSRFTANMMIGTHLPSCAAHYSILEETDFMNFLNEFQTDPHATAHSLIGGTYGCDKMKPLLDAGLVNDEDDMLSICSNWVFYIKEFYRYNYLTVKSVADCDASNPDAATCGLVCDSSKSSDLKFSLQNKIQNFVPQSLSTEDWDMWVEFICQGDGQKIFSGDQLESASPSDPSFWPIHPTLERLVHAKFMAGGFDSLEWATDPKNDYVCAKGECYESAYDSTDYYADCCKGHYQYDELMDAVSGNRSKSYGPTNDYIMKSTDPTSVSYSMPYIYDTFNWDHCDEDFQGLLVSLYNAAKMNDEVQTPHVVDVTEVDDAVLKLQNSETDDEEEDPADSKDPVDSEHPTTLHEPSTDHSDPSDVSTVAKMSLPMQ